MIAKLQLPAAELRDSLHELGVDVVERFDFGHRLQGEGELVRVKLPPGVTVEAGLALLGEREEVAYAEPNYRFYLDEPVREKSPLLEAPAFSEASEPNDLDYRLWGLHNTGRDRGKKGADISAKEAWTEAIGDRKNGPIIAIIDSGVDISHPDLVDNLWVNTGEIPNDGLDNDGNGVVDDVHGYNAFHNNSDLSDGKVHGTHVAGTIGATGNNGFGITGVAQQARMMTIKIFGDVGHTNEATVLRGMAYADRMGARITANSWGGIHSKAMEEAYGTSPALHIASAGNSGRDTDQEPHFPGSYPIDNMIAVAASDRKDEIGSFSNYGAQAVDLAAPGVDIYSTLPGERYKSFSGTSMACPHVAGVAGLILSKFPDATNEEVKARLLYSSEPLPELASITVSGGRLNAARALQNDECAPAQPEGFQAQASSNGVSLSWASLGDDGKLGQARLAKLSRNQANSPAVELQPKPGEAFFEDSFPLSKNERSIEYSLVAVDDVGNVSPTATAKARLPRARVHFLDRPETDWVIDGTWTVVESKEGARFWTESPDGNYKGRSRSSLTSPFFDLSDATGQVLRFQAELDLARGDYVKVEARSEDQGWRTLGRLEGVRDKEQLEFSLTKMKGARSQVRFVFQSDYSHNADGVKLSEIEVLSEPDHSNTSLA